MTIKQKFSSIDQSKLTADQKAFLEKIKNVTKDFTSCAFTEKVRRFCKMMTDLGHEVVLYAGEKNEAPVTEHVVCISEDLRVAAVGKNHYTTASFDINLPHWQVFVLLYY
jgi:hypothetical protein